MTCMSPQDRAAHSPLPHVPGPLSIPSLDHSAAAVTLCQEQQLDCVHRRRTAFSLALVESSTQAIGSELAIHALLHLGVDNVTDHPCSWLPRSQHSHWLSTGVSLMEPWSRHPAEATICCASSLCHSRAQGIFLPCLRPFTLHCSCTRLRNIPRIYLQLNCWAQTRQLFPAQPNGALLLAPQRQESSFLGYEDSYLMGTQFPSHYLRSINGQTKQNIWTQASRGKLEYLHNKMPFSWRNFYV